MDLQNINNIDELFINFKQSRAILKPFKLLLFTHRSGESSIRVNNEKKIERLGILDEFYRYYKLFTKKTLNQIKNPLLDYDSSGNLYGAAINLIDTKIFFYIYENSTVINERIEKNLVLELKGEICQYFYEQVLSKHINKQSTFEKYIHNNLFPHMNRPLNAYIPFAIHQKNLVLKELANALKHEISNPLLGIKLLANELTSTAVMSEQSEIFAGICQASKHCEQILTSFNEINMGIVHFTTTNINDLIKNTVKFLKLQTRGINIAVEFSNKSKMLKTNPTWLSQILFNLIINSAESIAKKSACKQQFQGKITINLKENTDHFTVDLLDNGQGIKESIQKYIYQPYYSTKNTGHGLGLAVCKNLADKINATVALKRSNKEFTIFQIILPKETNEKNINC